MLSSVKFMLALEEIRLRKESFDSKSLFATFLWLKHLTYNFSGQQQAIYMELTERYANAVLNSLSKHPAPKQPSDSVFAPPIPSADLSVVEDDALADTVCIFLAEQALNRKKYPEAESFLMNIPERSRFAGNISLLLSKVRLSFKFGNIFYFLGICRMGNGSY